MASFVWDRSHQEAYANPYEYDAQEQFLREATKFLDTLYAHLCGQSLRFHRDDTSREKAVWMLQVDALDALRDCLGLLKEKRHRVAGRLFRDIIETLDLAAYFHSDSEESRKKLDDWYADEIVPHRVYRGFIRRTEGEASATAKRDSYSSLSKWTHRTYRALGFGYTLGAGERLVYEGVADSGILIPPHTVSFYLALTADLIKFLSDEVAVRGILSPENVRGAWNGAMEAQSVPRRFVPHLPMP